MVTLHLESPITYSGLRGKSQGGEGYSAYCNAGQERLSSWTDLGSTAGDAFTSHAMSIFNDQHQDVLSPDAQSFTAAIKLYSEAKKTQLFQQNIRTRLVSYVQMTGEHWCVCVCLQRQRIVHTHTHTQTRAGCRHTGGRGLFLHTALAVSLRLPHSKSLNFS